MAKRSPNPEKVKVVTPGTLILGPFLLAFGVLMASGGGELGPLAILVGIVLTIVGWTTRQRRIRDEYAFRIQMLLHEAHDPIEDNPDSGRA